MPRSILRASIGLLVALLSGCLSPEGNPEGGVRPVPRESVAVAAAPEEPSNARLRADEDSLLADVSKRLAADPRFRQRFAESYLSETDIEPRITLIEREALLKILDLIAAERIEEAVVALSEHDDGSSSAAFDFTLGNIRFQQDRVAEAAQAYQAAVEKHPKFRRAWGNLGQIRFREGAFRGAISAFTQVIELGGADPLTYGLLGVAHSRLGNDLAAESAFRMASLMDPDSVDWKMGLAESFFRQERFPEAVALFSGLIQAQPERADLWMAQGLAYARANQPQRAAENFEVVDRLGGSTVESLDNLGVIYANQGLHDLAVGAYLRALRRANVPKPERAVQAAKYLVANGALEETRRLIAGIEEIAREQLDDGAKKDLLKIRARIALAEGSDEEEARVLEEIVRIDPLDGDALLLLGQFHGRTGRPEQAIFYYERAAGIEAFEAEAKVQHARLLATQGSYSAALPLLRRAQSIRPRENVQEFLTQVERAAQGRPGQ